MDAVAVWRSSQPGRNESPALERPGSVSPVASTPVSASRSRRRPPAVSMTDSRRPRSPDRGPFRPRADRRRRLRRSAVSGESSRKPAMKKVGSASRRERANSQVRYCVGSRNACDRGERCRRTGSDPATFSSSTPQPPGAVRRWQGCSTPPPGARSLPAQPAPPHHAGRREALRGTGQLDGLDAIGEEEAIETAALSTASRDAGICGPGERASVCFASPISRSAGQRAQPGCRRPSFEKLKSAKRLLPRRSSSLCHDPDFPSDIVSVSRPCGSCRVRPARASRGAGAHSAVPQERRDTEAAGDEERAPSEPSSLRPL